MSLRNKTTTRFCRGLVQHAGLHQARQQFVVNAQIDRRHVHQGRDGQIGVTTQQRLHRRHADRACLGQQPGQRSIHGTLAAPRRQQQNLQVFPARHTLRLRPRQLVVGLAKSARRKQVRLVAVAGERPGLAHQPVDHMPVIDVMLLLATQTRHRQLQLLRVPHLDRFGPHACFHPFSFQTRRDRVNVVLHLDRASLAHLHAQPHQGLQTPSRQGTEPWPFFLLPWLPAHVAPLLHRLQEAGVLLTAGKVPAATQQQGLLDRFLETPMSLFAIAVLVATRRVGCLRHKAILSQQRLVIPREHFWVAVRMHRQRHAVGPVSLGYPSQGPQRILQAFAQTGKTLRKTDRHMLPVRVGQHEVIHHVLEALPLDGHREVVHVREVRRAQSARLMHLREEHLLGWSRQGTPATHTALQGPQQFVAELAGIAFLQPGQQRQGLQAWRPIQLRLHLWPHCRQGIEPSPPGTCRTPLSGHLPLPILGCRLAVHARLEGRSLQRRAAL